MAGRADAPSLTVGRLRWIHHGFGPSGPGVHLVTTWRARGLRGAEVDVVLRAGSTRTTTRFRIERDEEIVHAPDVLVPYGRLLDTAGGRCGGWNPPPQDPASVEVRVAVLGAGVEDAAAFDVALPNHVRRLGGTGPARVVMALVACARAGGRPLGRPDVRFVREQVADAWALDACGEGWLRAWLHVLADAEPHRLGPAKVAARLAPHLPGDPRALLRWVARGAREAWPGPAAEDWLGGLAAWLGVPAPVLDGIHEELDAASALRARRAALAELGLSEGASLEEARAAWRALARAHHPDRGGDLADATARMARINAAWDLLRGGAR